MSDISDQFPWDVVPKSFKSKWQVLAHRKSKPFRLLNPQVLPVVRDSWLKTNSEIKVLSVVRIGATSLFRDMSHECLDHNSSGRFRFGRRDMNVSERHKQNLPLLTISSGEINLG